MMAGEDLGFDPKERKDSISVENFLF